MMCPSMTMSLRLCINSSLSRLVNSPSSHPINHLIDYFFRKKITKCSNKGCWKGIDSFYSISYEFPTKPRNAINRTTRYISDIVSDYIGIDFICTTSKSCERIGYCFSCVHSCAPHCLRNGLGTMLLPSF